MNPKPRRTRSAEFPSDGRPPEALGALRIRLAAIVILCVPLLGCHSEPAPSGKNSAKTRKTDSPGDSSNAIKPGLEDKIKFKTENGETAFSIKPENDGAKLVDSAEHELARFNLKGSKLKIKDPKDQVLGYIIAVADGYKIENADQNATLWKLQKQEDGDWKFEDSQGTLIYKVKRRDYGFEIESPLEASLYKVKFREGKTSLRDSSDRTVYYTKDRVRPMAVSCLGFESIDRLPLKTGLLTMLLLHPDSRFK